jgi:hypothetical protein
LRPTCVKLDHTPADSSTTLVDAAGDSLWKRAQAHPGDGKALTDPGLIRPGWVLTLPDAQVVAADSVATVAPLAGSEAGAAQVVQSFRIEPRRPLTCGNGRNVAHRIAEIAPIRPETGAATTVPYSS